MAPFSQNLSALFLIVWMEVLLDWGRIGWCWCLGSTKAHSIQLHLMWKYFASFRICSFIWYDNRLILLIRYKRLIEQYKRYKYLLTFQFWVSFHSIVFACTAECRGFMRSSKHIEKKNIDDCLFFFLFFSCRIWLKSSSLLCFGLAV